MLRTIRLLFSYLANDYLMRFSCIVTVKVQKIGAPDLDILVPEMIVLNFFDDTKYT